MTAPPAASHRVVILNQAILAELKLDASSPFRRAIGIYLCRKDGAFVRTDKDRTLNGRQRVHQRKNTQRQAMTAARPAAHHG